MCNYVFICTLNTTTMRIIVVNKTRLLFIKTQQNRMNDKHSFFNVRYEIYFAQI